MAKNPVLSPIFAHLAQILVANFFSKIWLNQSLDIMVSYHHVQHQKKLMTQYWENLVMDWRTDGQTDGGQTNRRTDRRTNDFTGRYPTNIERPISKSDPYGDTCVKKHF